MNEEIVEQLQEILNNLQEIIDQLDNDNPDVALIYLLDPAFSNCQEVHEKLNV